MIIRLISYQTIPMASGIHALIASTRSAPTAPSSAAAQRAAGSVDDSTDIAPQLQLALRHQQSLTLEEETRQWQNERLQEAHRVEQEQSTIVNWESSLPDPIASLGVPGLWLKCSDQFSNRTGRGHGRIQQWPSDADTLIVLSCPLSSSPDDMPRSRH